MDRDVMARAFNEWMRRFVEEPERFEREFATASRFAAETQSGEPSYGRTSVAYLESILEDLAKDE